MNSHDCQFWLKIRWYLELLERGKGDQCRLQSSGASGCQAFGVRGWLPWFLAGTEDSHFKSPLQGVPISAALLKNLARITGYGNTTQSHFLRPLSLGNSSFSLEFNCVLFSCCFLPKTHQDLLTLAHPPHLHLTIRNVFPEYSAWVSSSRLGFSVAMFHSPCHTGQYLSKVFLLHQPMNFVLSGTLSILVTATSYMPGSQEAQNKNLLNSSVNLSEEKVKNKGRKFLGIFLTLPPNSKNSKKETTYQN